MARAGETQRYAWRIVVEDREDGSHDMERAGEASELGALRRDLTHAVGDAYAHIGDHTGVVADEEDGWELRATAPPPTPKRKR